MSNQNKSLIVRAPAKINLHLEVLGLRNDGYHELAMIMQSISLSDYIEMYPNIEGSITLQTNIDNLTIGEDNLIIKAAKMLKEISGDKSLGVKINLIKNIPIGAGLAGGSTDAAAILIGLNSLWGLNYKLEYLENISSRIGSDIPFCIQGGRQLCFGRGEVLEKVESFNSNLGVILVKDPTVQVSTPWAYNKYKELFESDYLTEEYAFERKRNLVRTSNWIKHNLNEPFSLINDLQKVVLPVTPSVQNALDIFSNIPDCVAYAMSGSGPSCFGLFRDLNMANATLNKCKDTFTQSGLTAWSCSMQSEGITTIDQ